jgi:hypothetical protein
MFSESFKVSLRTDFDLSWNSTQGLTGGGSSNFEGIKFWMSKMSQFDQKFDNMANRHNRSRKWPCELRKISTSDARKQNR